MKKHEFFMKTAFLLAQESKCVKYQVGAVIVRDNRIISLGYNGTPEGAENCCDRFKPGYNREEHREWSIRNEIHAEMNALGFAARYGLETEGCDMYVTISPCNHCLKNIVSCGIKNVYYFDKYEHSDLSPSMLEKVNVERIGPKEYKVIEDFKNKL